MNKRPYMSFNNLISIAHNKHNVVSDDPQVAETLLKSFSYYTLINGYQNALEYPSHSEQFEDGFSLETLALFQLNESLLASNILWLILSVEKKFKTLVQDVISSDFGVLEQDYLKITNYNDKKNTTKDSVIKSIRSTATGYSDPQKKKKSYYDHPSQSLLKYRDEGNVPPWILVNDLTFGSVVKWFDIMPGTARRKIVNEFDINIADDESRIEFFSIALDLIRQFRNGLAHGDVINKIHSTTKLSWKHISELFPESVISKSEYTRQNIGGDDLFALLISVSVLASDLHKPYFKIEFDNRINAFNHLFASDTSITRRLLNLPDEFERRMDEIFQ